MELYALLGILHKIMGYFANLEALLAILLQILYYILLILCYNSKNIGD